MSIKFLMKRTSLGNNWRPSVISGVRKKLINIACCLLGETKRQQTLSYLWCSLGKPGLLCIKELFVLHLLSCTLKYLFLYVGLAYVSLETFMISFF